MVSVAIFDPTIGSKNLGDQIIASAVEDHLSPIADGTPRVATQRPLTRRESKDLRAAGLAVVAGTNLLSSNMPFYRQWKIGPYAYRSARQKAVLMGVGWWQYQPEPNWYSRRFLNHMLSRDVTHSVRDHYTEKRLRALGFKVLNTGCPTIWNLDDRLIPEKRNSDTCVVTLTDYNKRPGIDRGMIRGLQATYARVFLWPQSSRDINYVHGLGLSVQVLEPTLHAFTDFLIQERPDYVGTRLHGGVRALQERLFAKIVAVDNRATEMGKDFGLPVVPRDLAADRETLVAPRDARIRPPVETIGRWKSELAARVATGL